MKILDLKKPKKFLYLIILCLILNIFVFPISLSGNFNLNAYNNGYNNHNDTLKNQGVVYDDYTKEWIKNGGFNLPVDPWTNETTGDTSDLQTSVSDGAANYDVLGDKGTYTFAQDPISSGWTAVENPDFPSYPDTYTINGSGACVSHGWDLESADQSVAVNWDHKISLPVNMSDYVITSASIKAVVNGTVTVPSFQSSTFQSHGVEAGNDLGTNTTQYATGDYVQFYVLISDIPKNNVYEIASNKTTNLGQDYPPIPTMGDTLMVPVSEQSLIFYLTSVLNNDHQNFTLTIGMRIWCEDNFPQDSDHFNLLIIKSVNLTFTYEKKIDQLSTLSWKQTGNQVPTGNVNIANATLNFKYKINDTWTNSSPNSELRMKINNNLFGETVKLSSATTSFQNAKVGGFDVTPLISKGVNITLSIQAYMADQFILNRTIRISIDNVSLVISYTKGTTEDVTSLGLILNNVNRTLEKSVTVTYGKNVNITALYRDSTNAFIPNATVTLSGTDFASRDLKENSSLGSYYMVLNSTIFGLGDTYLNLKASKKYYETREATILINVASRDTELQLFLNNDNKTLDKSQDVSYGTTLNITILYQDLEYNPKRPISQATVNLTGIGSVKTLNESSQYKNYYILIETSKLGLGNTYLTVEAEKQNYTTQSIRFKINVYEKETYLDVFLNGTSTSSFSFYNTSIGDSINITVQYREQDTGYLINNANVSVFSKDLWILQKDPIYDQYYVIIPTVDLGTGVNVLSIVASKANYSTKTEEVTTFVNERRSEIQLFLDGVPKSDGGKITVEVDATINITVSYRDYFNNDFLPNASVRLVGRGNFTPYTSLEQYTFMINASELDQGITVLTVFAEVKNYESQFLRFFIEVIQRQTTLSLIINGEPKTSDPVIDVPIQSVINFTVIYNDNKSFSHIPEATIKLIGEGLDLNFTENTKFGQYTLIINTKKELNIGVNLLTIYASATNFEQKIINPRVTIRRINALIAPIGISDNKMEVRPSTKFTIKLSLNDTDFGGSIPNATMSFRWVFGSGVITDNNHDGIYEINVNGIPDGSYTMTITADAGDNYDFQTLQLTISAIRPVQEIMGFQIGLLIAALAAIGLGGYFIAYITVFRYPKQVRKIRKFRRSLKKKSAPNVSITDRQTTFRNQYQNELGKVSDDLGTKPKNISKIQPKPKVEDVSDKS
ncbi:MAG: hypothetical protein P8Y70_01050 [Candidatus Lokiarchaeota archaeon]